MVVSIDRRDSADSRLHTVWRQRSSDNLGTGIIIRRPINSRRSPPNEWKGKRCAPVYVARGVNLIEELERGDHLILVFRGHPQITTVRATRFNARMPFGIFKASISIAMVASMPIAMVASIRCFNIATTVW